MHVGRERFEHLIVEREHVVAEAAPIFVGMATVNRVPPAVLFEPIRARDDMRAVDAEPATP